MNLGCEAFHILTMKVNPCLAKAHSHLICKNMVSSSPRALLVSKYKSCIIQKSQVQSLLKASRSILALSFCRLEGNSIHLKYNGTKQTFLSPKGGITESKEISDQSKTKISPEKTVNLEMCVWHPGHVVL